MKNTTCRTSLNAAAAAFVVLVSATFAFSQTDVRNDGHGSKGPKGAACVIAEAGKPKITLVLGDQPSRPSRFAAEELKRIVREISGATCPIVTGKTDISGAMVAVGPPGENAVTAMLLQEAGVEFDSLELGPDGLLIHSVGPHVVLAGPTGRATLYAAYGLLERLGCRWCFPGEFGEVIPNKPSLKLNSLRVVEKPAFSYRTFMHHNHVTEETAEWIDWMAKNGLNYVKDPYDEERYRFESTLRAADDVRLLLVVGTSGATNLPAQICERVHRRGVPMIVVNQDASPFTEMAETSPAGHFARGAAGDWVVRIAEHLMAR